MLEKYMVNDVLSQIRNSCETFQYDLYKVAQSKGYYQPAEMATPEEVATVKNLFTQNN